MKAKSHIFSLVIMMTGLAMMTALLSGCNTSWTGISPDRYLANKRSFMLNQSHPLAYVEGYVDGCSTGRRLAGDKKFGYCKDTIRYERNALYARGWQNGQIQCRNEVVMEREQAERCDSESYLNLDEARRRRVEAESRAADAEVQDIWNELKK